MKILLINPIFKRRLAKGKISTVLPPLGLAYLAGILRENRIDVRILDMNALNLDVEKALEYIENYKPDVVGFSIVTTTIYASFEIAKKIKENFPKIQIVFGGPHPTSLPEESLKRDFVDFVVLGEGEITFLEFVDELKKNKPNFKKINGLVFKNKEKIIKNKERERIKNLDELPFPAVDLLPLNKYISGDSKHKKIMTILTSRGCPGRCTYCNKLIFGYTCYTRSADNIIKEIEFLHKKYGYKEFHILDDLFTVNRQRVIDFCNLVLKKRLKIIWRCGNGVRVNTVDLNLLKLMKKAGCYSLSYGIESGNQEILNKMKKGQTLEQCRNAVKWARQAGIECTGFFMFGNLGENRKTMIETINFAKSLDLDLAAFHILVPYPETEVRKIIEKEGKILVNDWKDYDNLTGKAIFEHGELTKELMEEMHKRAYKEFYMRPKYIIKRILRMKTLQDVKNNFEGFKNLLRYLI